MSALAKSQGDGWSTGLDYMELFNLTQAFGTKSRSGPCGWMDA